MIGDSIEGENKVLNLSSLKKRYLSVLLLTILESLNNLNIQTHTFLTPLPFSIFFQFIKRL